jgi:hypothetical protein
MDRAAEFPFSLPHGYVDADGQLHRDGHMRLATALDEVAPLKDPRVQANPAYLSVILLSRVVTGLGSLPQVYPSVIEGLPVADFAFLQGMYQRVNQHGHDRLAVSCPHCAQRFEVEVPGAGEP